MKRVWSGIWTMTLYYIFGKWYIEIMRGVKWDYHKKYLQKNYGQSGFLITVMFVLRDWRIYWGCNLKLRKGKTLDDVKLIIGRALKDTPCIASKQIERIAEETDKVCIIANWEDAVAKYKG